MFDGILQRAVTLREADRGSVSLIPETRTRPVRRVPRQEGIAPYRLAGTASLDAGTLRMKGTSIQSGPALAVYLTPEAGATNVAGAVKLGPLKGTSGDHDYALPSGTDASAYRGVLIWCDRFSVPFGTAALN